MVHTRTCFNVEEIEHKFSKPHHLTHIDKHSGFITKKIQMQPQMALKSSTYISVLNLHGNQEYKYLYEKCRPLLLSHGEDQV